MKRYLPVTLITAVQITTALAALTIPTMVPLVQQQTTISTTPIGLFISMLYAAAAVITLGAGALIRRWGPIRIHQLALLACSVGLVTAGQGSEVALLFASVALGIGYGPITPASSAFLAATTELANRRLIFSLKQTGVPAGAALAGLVVPALMVAIGWRETLQILSAFCIVLAAALQPVRDGCDQLFTRHAVTTRLRLLHSVALLFQSPSLRQLAVIAFVLGGAQMCVSTFIVSYFFQTLHYPPSTAGLMLAVANTAGIIFRLVWGYMVDRGVKTNRLLALLSLVTGVSAVFFASPKLMQFLPFALITCFAAGAAAIGWNGILLAQVATVAKANEVSDATAGCLFFSFAGVMIFPALFGWLKDLTGSYTIPWVCICAFATTLGLSMLFKLRREKLLRDLSAVPLSESTHL